MLFSKLNLFLNNKSIYDLQTVNVVVLYDDVATIFAATCAIVFCVIGVLGK